jgi:hypothetical protein
LIAIGISITAMAMYTFNTVRITQLNNEINTLKEKTDLILDIVHLHEKHLHHLEEKLDPTIKLLADLLESNIWFSEKKLQSVVHHHENIVKSAQHHQLAPGALPQEVLDGIINHIVHIVQVAKKKNLVPFCEVCLRPLSNRGLTPVQTGHERVHANSAHPNGHKLQPA